jgi:hypothetical protein
MTMRPYEIQHSMERGKFCVWFKNHLETDTGSVCQYLHHICGTMTMLTRAIHWCWLWSEVIQCVTSYYISQLLIVLLSWLVCLCLLNYVYRFTDQNFVSTFQFIQAWNIPCTSYSPCSAHVTHVSNVKWVVRTLKLFKVQWFPTFCYFL